MVSRNIVVSLDLPDRSSPLLPGFGADSAGLRDLIPRQSLDAPRLRGFSCRSPVCAPYGGVWKWATAALKPVRTAIREARLRSRRKCLGPHAAPDRCVRSWSAIENGVRFWPRSVDE